MILLNNKRLCLSLVALLSFAQTALADFNTTVTLNGVTRSYSFPDAETALTVDQTSYRNDFKNPETGLLPNSSVGQITQFDFQGKPLTLIRTDATTLVVAPVSGTTTDFVSLTGSGLYKQFTNFLASGTFPSSAKSGLTTTTLANLTQIIQQQIPASNTSLKDQLTQAIAKVSADNLNDATTALVQLTQKFADTGVTCDLNRNDALCARTLATAAVAGNPASLMGTMVDQIFLQTGNAMENTAASNTHTRRKNKNRFALGLQYGHYNLAGNSVDTVTIPLSYTAKLNAKNQLIVSLPLTYVNTQGNNSYQVGGGIAYRYQPNNNWSLTPAINYAYRGTPNSGNGLNRTEGHILAGTLTSQYAINIDQWTETPIKLEITNMLGYFQSLDMQTTIKGKAYETSGEVANVVLKNGIALSQSIGDFNWSAFLTDTEYFKSQLYFEQYNEVGIAMRPEHAGKLWNSLSVSANYLFSLAKGQHGDLDGFRLNLGYQF
jgi:hypothetical protein